MPWEQVEISFFLEIDLSVLLPKGELLSGVYSHSAHKLAQAFLCVATCYRMPWAPAAHVTQRRDGGGVPGPCPGTAQNLSCTCSKSRSSLRAPGWLTSELFLACSSISSLSYISFSGGASGKEPACQCKRCKRQGFDPWVGKIPWRRSWQPTPVFLPGESPWTEEPGGLQSIGLQRIGHDWSSLAQNTVDQD